MLKVVIIGHLGQDAQLKTFNNVNYLAFSVAHSEKYLDSKGNNIEKTTWISCLKRIGETSALQNLLKKGIKVYVEGTLSVKVFDSMASNKPEASINCNVSHIDVLTFKEKEEQEKPFVSAAEPFQKPSVPADNDGGTGDDLPF